MRLNRRDWLRSATVATAAGLFVRPEQTILNTSSISKQEPGKVLLNSNENALGPSEMVRKAIAQSVTESNRYPWETRQILVDRISKLEGIPADNIMLGAGSTELLQLAGMAFGAYGGTIVSSYPTFPMMMQHASGFDAKWLKVSLTSTMDHDLNGLKDAASGAQLVYISNPNNPVGTMTGKKDLLDFCKSMATDTIIFVDEAYMEFSDPGLEASLAHHVMDLPNLIVARTFSKIYGMAGLRVGYAYAHPNLLEKMKHYHIGFEINMPITSLYAAIAAAEDQDFVKYCKEENRQIRLDVYQKFDAWEVKYLASQTNFIYFETKRFAEKLVSLLEKHQVLIRDYDDQPGYARVSMGTSPQIQQFLDAAKLYISR
ncbi:MAG: histidinol-phosphate aminotransferase family protein [Saprospiraceae bacterium]|nr:histidinol-phosphate aminotransferase family protein [Saprospiraceae bacterium]